MVIILSQLYIKKYIFWIDIVQANRAKYLFPRSINIVQSLLTYILHDSVT